jgi:hypothetical protein
VSEIDKGKKKGAARKAAPKFLNRTNP